MGPLSAGPPHSLHIGDGLVGHVSVYGPAFRGSSSQSPHRRQPCGLCGCMVLLSAGPPHSLHIGDGFVGLVGVWACFPQVLPTISKCIYLRARLAMWALG